MLQDKDLVNVHLSNYTVLPHVPENQKRVLLGAQRAMLQDYCWVNRIEYQDSQERIHNLNLFTCQETKPDRHGDLRTTTFKWLTNFILTQNNVDTLANQGGRFRWKIENEDFNIQKNSGYNLEHPYSQDGTARQVFYFLLQIAHLIF